MTTPQTPSWRKPFGVLVLLAYVTIWVIIVASASPWIGAWHWTLQTLLYFVAGVIWILPLGPWLKWMETGRFR
jgi:Protein of unknown function (DUF2842)